MRHERYMDLIDIQKDLKKVLSAKRYRHSAGVADSARALADKYGANAEKAYIAGWVHDCAKELSLSEMHDIVNFPGRLYRAIQRFPRGGYYQEACREGS